MHTNRHLILGAGTIGTETARALRALGEDVTLASRSGVPHSNGGVAHLRVDALDGPALRAATAGATHLYLTLGLSYRARIWERDWPRIMQNAIDAALAQDAGLVWFDNVYAYGPLPLAVPMTEEHPIAPPSRKGRVRAQLLAMIQDAAERRRLRWLVARSADFYGPGVRLSILFPAAIQRQLHGRAAWWLGNPDLRHSFTYTPDAGRALAQLALDPGAWMQSWHLPTAEPAPTPRELLRESARLLGAPEGVRALPRTAVALASPLVPLLREVAEMLYQNRQDYVFSSAKFASRYPDFRVTPYAAGIRAMVRSFRQPAVTMAA